MSAHTVAAVDWQGGLSDAWSTVADFVPRLVIFAIILVVGWFIAKVLAKIVDTILERVGFDRAVERGGIKAALARSQYDASDLIAKVVQYAILLLTLVVAFNVFGPNPISALLSDLVAWLPKLAIAIVIIVVASAIAKGVKDLIGGMLGGLSYGNVLATIASVFILFLGIVAALNQIGVATTVTTPVLITILATIGGIIVVGAGGGLVRPMQSRWERWLDNAERESGNIRNQVRASSAQRGSTHELDSDYDDEQTAAGRRRRHQESVDLREDQSAYDPSLETRRL